jgi:hypothetical protein
VRVQKCKGRLVLVLSTFSSPVTNNGIDETGKDNAVNEVGARKEKYQ